MRQVTFHFKAATGFGAVIDGSVESTSSSRVAKDIMKQGLIPVRIWAEREPDPAFALSSLGRLLGSMMGKCRSFLHV